MDFRQRGLWKAAGRPAGRREEGGTVSEESVLRKSSERQLSFLLEGNTWRIPGRMRQDEEQREEREEGIKERSFPTDFYTQYTKHCNVFCNFYYNYQHDLTIICSTALCLKKRRTRRIRARTKGKSSPCPNSYKLLFYKLSPTSHCFVELLIQIEN